MKRRVQNWVGGWTGRASRLVSVGVGVLGPITVVSVAAAQSSPRVPESNGPGLDTHLFRPAVDSKGFFTVNGSDTLGARNVSLGLVTDYGHNLMRLARPRAGDGALVRHSFQGNFLVNYGILNRWMVGVQVPINLMFGEEVTGVGPAAAPYNTGTLNAQSIPYIALHTKLQLLRNNRFLGVGLLVQGGLATIRDPARTLGGDPKAWVWPELIIDRQFGPQSAGNVHLGLNVGYRTNSANGTTRFDQLSGGRFASSNGKATGGLAASVRVFDALDLVAEAYATRQINSASASATALSAEAIGGLKIFVEKNSYLMIGGGARLTNGFEAADQRGFLGFVFEPSIGDRDGDGIRDDEDKCPDQPEDIDGFEDEDGCPDLDNDKDGIPDNRDRCPNQAETVNGFEDEDGCPDVDSRDRDGDGIPNWEDACPDVPGVRSSDPKKNGCPADRDGDGIPDAEDACPDVPGVRSSDPKKNGCPADRDGDGIPDSVDKCPDEPETVNGFEDEDGCPDKGKVVVQDNNILILEKVQFETGSAAILPASNSLLDAVAATLKGHPEFDLIEVQGHADERGSTDLNLRLTRDRANSVVDALVQRSVDKTRLRGNGYGKYCPLDPGHTPAAYEKNRRVEFKVVRNNGASTNTELGCPEAKKHGVTSAP